MAAPVSPEDVFSSESRLYWFEPTDLSRDNEVCPDGERFVTVERVGEATAGTVHIVETRYEEFRDRERSSSELHGGRLRRVDSTSPLRLSDPQLRLTTTAC